MTEALAAMAAEPEEPAEEQPETGANTKTKVITAAALGALGVAGGYAEARGLVHGWPPPFHSLKHPWIGYYSAWAAGRLSRYRSSAMISTAAAADLLTETTQDAVLQPDHYPFRWLNLHAGPHS